MGLVDRQITQGMDVRHNRKEPDYSCSSDVEDNLVCPRPLSEELSQELVQRQVRLVKQYAYIKGEMLGSEARDIAGQLYQQKKLSQADHESICNYKFRRDAVDKLLKKVLMGPLDIHSVFILALKENGKESTSVIADVYMDTHVSDSEIELFNTLEKASLKQCLRPHSYEPRFSINNSDQETLLYFLNNENTIDILNDNLLSRFVFSIREHTNVRQCAMDDERRVRRLIATMKKCSDRIFSDICQILDAEEMNHVVRKLEKRKEGEANICRQRQKRKMDKSQEGKHPSTSEAKRLCTDSLMETRIVSSLQRSSSALRKQALAQIGFDVDTINKGSIVIQFIPKMADSWSRLKENCINGKIKDLIPFIYHDYAKHGILPEGKERKQLTIYTLPVPPESTGQQKAMFCLASETDKPKEIKQRQQNPIEDHQDILCEELEISNALLGVLKKEKLVEENIKTAIDKQGSRVKRNKYLLKVVGRHGVEGYKVLKDFIKNDNEALYNMLDTRDGVTVIDERLDNAAKVTTRSKQDSHRVVFKKELFFSAVIVMEVRTKSIGMEDTFSSKTNLKTTSESNAIEISCPEIINPVCHFNSDNVDSVPSEEAAMKFDEVWRSVGEDTKWNQERDILTGKRKKGNDIQTEEESRKWCKGEEQQDSEISESTTDKADLNSSDM